MNPAIGVGINIVNAIASGSATAIQAIYVYAGIPLAGGLVAALFFEKLYKKISFNDTEMSALEQFYNRKNKQVHRNSGQSEEELDDTERDDERANSFNGKGGKKLKIQEYEEDED